MRIFLTGGTGLVGARLIPRLHDRQDSIVLLSRRPEVAQKHAGPQDQVVAGDPMKAGPWMDAIAGCDAVIHLAGENVFAKRWSEKFKTMLIASRVKSTELIVQALARSGEAATGKNRVLVNASAIGYYGPHADEEVDEASPPGDDFLARLCVAWENAARQAEPHGVRVALVRVGMVLDKAGGALAPLLMQFKLFAGGPVGWGKQWISWIHYGDLVGIILMALDNADARGPINGVGPNPVTNKQFARTLGQALGRPSFLPTPPIAFRIMLGEVAQVVATGQRVLPRRALALGYAFQFPTLQAALADILK
jgi:uncharacterized protein (TIGR01777 family)